MLNISNLWLLFDGLAFVLVVLNIYLILRRKRKYCIHLAFSSITFECLALLAEFQKVVNKVIENNVSYILDVIPSINSIRTPIVLTLLFINCIIMIFDLVMKIVSNHRI